MQEQCRQCLTSQYNPQIAYSAAMSHEARPYADIDKRVFGNEGDADVVTDLLNNEIVRKIGYSNRYLWCMLIMPLM